MIGLIGGIIAYFLSCEGRSVHTDHISHVIAIYVVMGLFHLEVTMWLILIGIAFLYFVVQGNILGIIVVILFTAVALPGIGGRKTIDLTQSSPLGKAKKKEKYIKGDIYGIYTDPLALHQQQKERMELERNGRERI